MGRKPKLTPTTNDQLHGNGLMNLQTIPLTPANPLIFPNIPLPPKVERPAEQKVNGGVTPVAEPPPLKIALVGTAPSSRMLAPYNDPTWKVWACSPGNMGTIPRFDAWIEVHGTNLLEPENQQFAPQYIAWMANLKCPLYMQDKRVIPHAIPIPKERLLKEFGPYFFTSSFAWMMGMAMLEGAKEIALYGIDMASKDEYILQRAGGHYFIIEGARRGCKVWAPYESDIMQPPALYGYSEVTPYGRKLRARKAELLERVNGMRQQRDSLIHSITYLEGALEDNDYQQSIQGGVYDNTNISYLDSLLQKASAPEPVKPVSVSLPSQE